jgi:hypothetical protein
VLPPSSGQKSEVPTAASIKLTVSWDDAMQFGRYVPKFQITLMKPSSKMQASTSSVKTGNGLQDYTVSTSHNMSYIVDLRKYRLVREQSMVGLRTIAFILHANKFWWPGNVNISLAHAWKA